MGDLVNVQGNDAIDNADVNPESVVECAEAMINDARNTESSEKEIRIPIAELSTLGAAVSSMIPAFRTITQTVSMDSSGLFRILNASDGALKMAKGGDFAWGALKSAEGKSVMAKLQSVDAISGTAKGSLPIDPATLMMAAALYSIERQLGNIEDMQKKILSFMEIEKESEIEGNLKILIKIIKDYKLSWNNDLWVQSHHQTIVDIQRKAQNNVISYQKTISEVLKEKNLFVSNVKISSTLDDLQKKFKYYRLSLYTYAMASLTEIMLSKNFNEEYIAGDKKEIDEMALGYRNLFTDCSVHLEKLKGKSIEDNIVKGIGTAGAVVGNLIGKIPVIKNGPVDEMLMDGGGKILNGVDKSQKRFIESFAQISDPETSVFTERMSDLIRIYNHTSEIRFDKDNIYLIAG